MSIVVVELETERLRLRQWTEDDYAAFAKLNADPEVMKYFPRPIKQKESDEMARNIQFLIKRRGWGLWAVEEKYHRQFAGFVGLHEPQPDLPFSPCVEIGWRLSKTYWGKGYATEAAKEALKFAFVSLDLTEVYSFAAAGNIRSRAVMEDSICSIRSKTLRTQAFQQAIHSESMCCTNSPESGGTPLPHDLWTSKSHPVLESNE